MVRLGSACLTLAFLCGVGAAAAQDFSGSYSTPMGAGATLSLVLRQDAAGRITGTLSGNTAFQIQAQVQNGQLAGFAVATGGRLYLEGRLQGTDLMLALAEVGPDGQPQAQTARTVMMTRTAAGQASGGVQGGRFPGGNQAAPGAAGDPYVGTFTNGEITITLSRSGQGYAGSASYQGQQFPLAAQPMGDRLAGMYQANGTQAPFQAMVQGDAMVLATNEGSFQLQRTGGGAMGGGAPMGAPGAMAGPGAAVGGGSPQDQQVTQLLLRSAWCSFSYNQTTGTTRTERYVFRPDGTGSQGTGAETYSSGYGGTVAGQHQGGQAFRWRVQNGMLMVSADGVNWSPQQLQVTQNSNGSPIVRANGTEYSMCQ